VTYLGLEYGPNDFTLAAPIGSSVDSTARPSRGALNYSIRRLLTTYSELRLFLIAPSWRLNFEDLDSDTHPNRAPQTLPTTRRPRPAYIAQ